ncbi:glycoside hydrolase family 9 protein [Flavobacterium branchiophilum]|uniref:Glycoside hydrolase n=1 Tax=Flavobacterium branchiophilum TaxID=55197 RepID=A0A2H3KIS5_9FLAO|nr:glycoside hydrolase family 9 protein [Flavobacterium branchiophilum]PDS24530.1 glycoside hydrolase [Flavobacterium branchiophilum]
MKLKTFFILLISSISFAQNPFIEVDQFGYFTTGTKVAVLRNPQTGFNAAESYTASATLQVKNSSNTVVYTGAVSIWNAGITDSFSGDKGWWFDFSSVTVPGTYYIYDATNAKSSATFQIATNPYTEVLKAATKMFYYNRCNFTKAVPFANSKWTDGLNFNNNLQDYNARSVFAQNNAATEKELSGGWFDAGDYNKYVTFTYSVIHDLLMAYESNPAIFGDDWNIPESGNNVPDILDELKYELDWLYKMSNSDGSVYIKMGSKNYSQNSSYPPSANTDPRYYGNLCTAASATIASTFSHAAIIFNAIGNTTYASQLQNRAIACYNYTLPFYTSNTLQTNCDNGEIVSGDADVSSTEQKTMMVSAAIYLYKLTNIATYNTFITTNAPIITPLSDSNWGADYTPIQDALLYYTTLPNATTTLVNSITNAAQNDVTNNWNNFYGISNLGLYRDYMPQWAYYWGSNRIKAKYGNLNLLYAKYGIGNASNLKNRAKELMHSFHGVNPLGIVQLSNMYEFGADYSINELYHQWFANGSVYDNAITSSKGPAPGYLVGGPNKDFSVTSLSPPYGQPATKSYLDFNDGYPNNSWEVSEPAINNQAAYIRLLAGVISNFDTNLLTISFENNTDFQVAIYPNPSNGEWEIHSHATLKNVKAFDILGKEVKVNTISNNKFFINKSGIFILKIELNNGKIVHKRIIIK